MSRLGVMCILTGLAVGMLSIATFGITTFSNWITGDAVVTVRYLAAAGPILGLVLIGIGGSPGRSSRQSPG